MSETKYKAMPNVVDCDIGGERALLNMYDNTYYTTNRTASELWLALADSKTVSDLVSVLTERFDIDPTSCREDVYKLISQMIEAGIVETVRG